MPETPDTPSSPQATVSTPAAALIALVAALAGGVGGVSIDQYSHQQFSPKPVAAAASTTATPHAAKITITQFIARDAKNFPAGKLYSQPGDTHAFFPKSDREWVYIVAHVQSVDSTTDAGRTFDNRVVFGSRYVASSNLIAKQKDRSEPRWNVTVWDADGKQQHFTADQFASREVAVGLLRYENHGGIDAGQSAGDTPPAGDPPPSVTRE